MDAETSWTDGALSPSLPAERSADALAILAYNQELVQFADSKAGTLIVINSLFIAAFSRTGSPVMQGIEIACVLAGSLAMLASLRVVLAGRAGEAPRKRPDVVFFQDIRRRSLARQYVRDFVECTPEELATQVMLRTYAVAGIAERKFDAYAFARQATAFTAVIWLVGRGVSAILG